MTKDIPDEEYPALPAGYKDSPRSVDELFQAIKFIPFVLGKWMDQYAFPTITVSLMTAEGLVTFTIDEESRHVTLDPDLGPDHVVDMGVAPKRYRATHP